jgi:hypothetical protein
LRPDSLPEIVDILEVKGRIHLPGVIISLEYRRCGKNCSGCPHGPYVYARDRLSHRRKYLGSLKNIRRSRALRHPPPLPTTPADT